MVKCRICKNKISFLGSYGNPFLNKYYCQDCWWEKNEWTEETFMGQDEINELRIKELTKRIEKLEFAKRGLHDE